MDIILVNTVKYITITKIYHFLYKKYIQYFVVFIDVIDCINVNLAFDPSDSNTRRQIEIRATQFICGDDNGGPPGCLQYFQDETGTVSR